MQNFIDKFRFDGLRSLFVGVEREGFLVRDGCIVPIAPEVLSALPNCDNFSYELSACQIEDRIGPCQINDVRFAFLQNERILSGVERKLNFGRQYTGVVSDDIPLDVFPDPTGRYQKITKDMPREILLAACQVAAVHVHIGMPDHSSALRVYNKVIGHLKDLCEIGDLSEGRRLSIYKKMAPDYLPRPYENWKDFYTEAVNKGFVEDPRKCWHLIRISVHGTIEFRVFGSTDDIDLIESWARKCRNLCQEAL